MSSSLQTPRKTTIGLGSAKGGTHHFIVQRVTAIALVPLVIWFLVALVAAFDGGYAGARAFIGDPVNAVLLLLLVTTAFWHMQLGLADVLEDYVSDHGAKATLMILNVFVAAVLWVVAIVSILMVVV